jgi:hypothetical protein
VTIDRNAPVHNIVESFDRIFELIGVSEERFQDPSHGPKTSAKVCGLTNTYLKPVRIGRKISFDPVELYYGRKVRLFQKPFETVPFYAAADVHRFMGERITEQTTDYFSIQLGSQILNVDMEGGVVKNMDKLGFDNFFLHVAKDKTITEEGLVQILKDIRTLSQSEKG